MIDVSSNNHSLGGQIDYGLVARAGYGAVMVKCSEGLTYRNPWRKLDGEGFHAKGLHVGYYHFARPDVGDAAEQADFAIAAIAGLPRDIGLALDLEVSGGLSEHDLTTWAKNFLARVSQHAIGAPIYSNVDFMTKLPELPFGHRLWLASWGKSPTVPVWAWQQGQTVVPGIHGETDYGIWYG